MIEIKITGETVGEVKAAMRNLLEGNGTVQITQQLTGTGVVEFADPTPKKKPGRPAGTKLSDKHKEAIREVQKEIEPPKIEVVEVKVEPPPVNKVFPSEAEVQNAVVAVNDKFGIDKAIECLSKFNVKRARELKEDQRIGFIDLCNQVLNLN